MTIQTKMTNDKMTKRGFDLEERTLKFAKGCVDLCQSLPKNMTNSEFTNQLIRSSSSVGANYREANDSITRKEFYHRIGISRKESKESKYWLELVEHSNVEFKGPIDVLIEESFQLTKIFSAISLTGHNDKG